MGGIFKALGDPTRREILKILRNGDKTAGEIAEQFEMSKPAISKHLDILSGAELISWEKQGQYRIYSINLTVLQEAISEFMNVFDKENEHE